jgi:hypothetical protein
MYKLWKTPLINTMYLFILIILKLYINIKRMIDISQAKQMLKL